MHEQHQVSLLPVERQGPGGHTMLLKLTVITVIAFFVTVLLFTWMTRETLCELHITSPTMEVVALLTCTLKL